MSGSLARVGVWAWSVVGMVAVAVIATVTLAAVSEIVLPLVLAAVLAVCARPLVSWLEHRRVAPVVAAGVVVIGLLVAAASVLVATGRGVVQQSDEVASSVDLAVDEAVATLQVDEAALASARESVADAAPLWGGGLVTELLGGIDKLLGLASGVLLGALIMYYLLKDGRRLRRSLLAQLRPPVRAEVDDFLSASCRTLRDYGRARTVMAFLVAVAIGVVALALGLPLVFTIVVANFVGGYVPYIGAFLGGGLAVVVALGEGGIGAAAVMLAAVLVGNLVLENFVEPRVMGRTLGVHPLAVLVVTAVGGIVGGIVGLILAVPAWVIATTAVSRLRRGHLLDRVADRADPRVRRLLDG